MNYFMKKILNLYQRARLYYLRDLTSGLIQIFSNNENKTALKNVYLVVLIRSLFLQIENIKYRIHCNREKRKIWSAVVFERTKNMNGLYDST